MQRQQQRAVHFIRVPSFLQPAVSTEFERGAETLTTCAEINKRAPTLPLFLLLLFPPKRPDEGWSHNTAALAVGQGVYYSFPVRYVGSIQVMESMRSLSMPDKTAVCWEAIARCVRVRVRVVESDDAIDAVVASTTA